MPKCLYICSNPRCPYQTTDKPDAVLHYYRNGRRHVPLCATHQASAVSRLHKAIEGLVE